MIICKNCGGELPDGAKFCTKCGYAVIPEEELRAPEEAQAYDDWNAQAEAAQAPKPYENTVPQYDQTYQNYQPYQQTYQQPYQQPVPYQDNASYNAYRSASQEDPAKTDLGRTAMIIAIVGAALGAIPGIILCAIARGKVKEYINRYGEPTGMAKAANIVSKVGLILSIVSLVVIILYVILEGIFVGGMLQAFGVDWEDVFEELFHQFR